MLLRAVRKQVSLQLVCFVIINGTQLCMSIVSSMMSHPAEVVTVPCLQQSVVDGIFVVKACSLLLARTRHVRLSGMPQAYVPEESCCTWNAPVSLLSLLCYCTQ